MPNPTPKRTRKPAKPKRKAGKSVTPQEPQVNTGAKQGDGGERRSEGQRALDVEFIWPLYIKGWTYRQIANELNAKREYSVTHGTVWRDVKAVLAEWRKFRLDAIDDMKADELARINQMEREAWDAWENSKGTHERRITDKRAADVERDKDGKLIVGKSGGGTRTQTEECAGDPAFLKVVQWCIEKRCKILGLDAPVKVKGELSGPDGRPIETRDVTELTDAQLAALLAAEAGKKDDA